LALRRYQIQHGLRPRGIVDAGTAAALNVPAQTRLFEIQVNLDRYRRLPRRSGNRNLLLNLGSAELEGYDRGERVLTSSIHVGRRCAPSGDVASLTGVVFHPHEPGASEAHDGPAPLHFAFARAREAPFGVRGDGRACVDVVDPLELAEFVLQAQDWDHDAVLLAVERGEQRVSLRRSVPVSVLNLTVYPANEELRFRRDALVIDQELVRRMAARPETPAIREAADQLAKLAAPGEAPASTETEPPPP
jgi:murein L,D-transpeptidase YcbB/YkuD